MKLRVITFISLIYTLFVVPIYCEVQPVEHEPVVASTPSAQHGSSTEKPTMQHLDFVQAFIGAFSVIVVSELGDKTFFIAAIMAMRHPRIMVFLGAILALAFMTVLSVAFGWAATIIPKKFTYYASTILFLIFGIKMIRDGIKMSPTESQEEYEEVQADLRKKEEEFEKETLTKDVESGYINRNSKVKILKVLSHIIVQAFTLTFLAEWGDRSQITTIILAARDNVYGVALGGIAGHTICTGLAVIGGRFIAQKISVKTVTIVGGFVFIIFAVITVFLES